MEPLYAEEHMSMRWKPPSSAEGGCMEPLIQFGLHNATKASQKISRGCTGGLPSPYQINEQHLMDVQYEKDRCKASTDVNSCNTDIHDNLFMKTSAVQSEDRLKELRESIGSWPARTVESFKQLQSPLSNHTSEEFVSYASSPTVSEIALPRSQTPRELHRPEASLSQGATTVSADRHLQTQMTGPNRSKANFISLSTSDDPRSWAIADTDRTGRDARSYSLEEHARTLFSAEHLYSIVNDPKSYRPFAEFLSSKRPQSICILNRYIEAQKALRAISYANSVVQSLNLNANEQCGFTTKVPHTKNDSLVKARNQAFDVLLKEDLPLYIVDAWGKLIRTNMHSRITSARSLSFHGVRHGREEMFCLTDPTRSDNPIVLVSEEFARFTQYGIRHILGRNCRFLQGPGSDFSSIQRLAAACAAGREHSEILVNYRRNGTPFLNFLTIAPLVDKQGVVRFFIGAQVDLSGLLEESNEIEAFDRLLSGDRESCIAARIDEQDCVKKLQDLSKMFNRTEAMVVREHAGTMFAERVGDWSDRSFERDRRRVLIKDESQADTPDDCSYKTAASSLRSSQMASGCLSAGFDHYLIVEPAYPFRILFASRTFQDLEILQSQFFHHIGKSNQRRDDLQAALVDGVSITAKTYWLHKPNAKGQGDGRSRWVHCTPLVEYSGAVGLYMVVLIDREQTLDHGYW